MRFMRLKTIPTGFALDISKARSYPKRTPKLPLNMYLPAPVYNYPFIISRFSESVIRLSYHDDDDDDDENPCRGFTIKS